MISLPVEIGREKFEMTASLSDRSEMNHEILIGRRFLKSNGIIVDVGKIYLAKKRKGGKK